MASAYELMLVLRGRNYLSNDLRRAGGDLRRLQTQGGLANQRKQIQINAQRLATTKAIAQAEIRSIETGTRRVRLDQAINSLKEKQAVATDKLIAAQDALVANERAQLANAEKLAAVNAQMGRTPMGSQNYALLREQAAQLTQANEVLIAQQAELAGAVAKSENALAKLGMTEQQLAGREAEMAQRRAILNDRINTTTAALELNTVKLNENALAMRRLPFERLAAGARYVEHLGRSFQTMGLFAVAALGYAAHSAAQFSTQITLASTQATEAGNRTTRTVQANAAQINRAVMQMLNSGQSAAKPTDLTQGLYSIYSGITLTGPQKSQIQQGIDILKQFNRVYIANYGQVQFNDVVKAGIALINNFGLNAKSLPGVLNRMQASVRYGAMTMGDFVNSLNQVVPAFRGAHYGFDQMAADIAFVSRLFPSLRFGTAGLARLTEILSNKKTIAGIKEQLGINIAPGGNLLPIDQIVKELIAKRPNLAKGGVGLTNFFKDVSGQQGTIQARRVFVGFATNMKLYDTLSKQVVSDNRELAKSFTDMSQTPQVRWAEFTNQLRGLILTIGTQALPVFTELAGPIKNLVHWFDQLDPSTQKMIVRFVAWGGVISLVGGTLLIFVGAVLRAYATIRLFLIGRGGLLAAEGGFTTAGLALRGGLLAAIIIALPLIMKMGHGFVNMNQGLNILIAAFAAFKITAFLSQIIKAQMGIMLLRSELMLLTAAPWIITLEVIGLEYITKRVKQLQEMEIAAASRTLDKKSLSREVSAFLPEFQSEKMAGKTGAQLYKEWRGRLGTSDIASQVLTALFQATGVNMPKDIAASQARGIGARRNYVPGDVPTPNVGGGAGNTFNAAAAIANVERLRRISEQKKTYASYLAYEKAFTELQKHYQGDQLTALNDYLNSIESAEKKSNKKREGEQKRHQSQAKKDMLAAQKEVTQAAQTLQSQYQSLYQQNQSAFGQLFNGPFINSPRMQNEIQWGHKLTGRDLLKDIRSQVAQFRQWRHLLAQLRKRGIVGDLYDQIVAAGPGAIQEVRALLSLGNADLRSYAKSFNAGQNLVAQATKQDMNISLMRYRKYGRNIALQIIQGLRDEHTPVLKVFENMILKDFPGLAKAAHGKGSSPTRGKVRDTTPAAATHHDPGPRKPAKPKITRTVSSAAGGNTYVDAPTYNVTSVDPKADVPTQLKHAHFVHRNRYHL